MTTGRTRLLQAASMYKVLGKAYRVFCSVVPLVKSARHDWLERLSWANLVLDGRLQTLSVLGCARWPMILDVALQQQQQPLEIGVEEKAACV